MKSCPFTCIKTGFNGAGLFKIQIFKQPMASQSKQPFLKVKALVMECKYKVLCIKGRRNQSIVQLLSRETRLLKHCLFNVELQSYCPEQEMHGALCKDRPALEKAHEDRGE